MDFRNLVEKLNKIEQAQLLTESEAIMERLRNKDIMATANIKDETERLATLGKMARENGFGGLFDPTNGKFVNADGKYAAVGAYQSEIEQLEKYGLLPPNADTSSMFGAMGKEAGAAQAANKLAVDRDTAIDRANELLAKALGSATTGQSTKPTSDTAKITPETDPAKAAQAVRDVDAARGVSSAVNATDQAAKKAAGAVANENSILVRSGIAKQLTESFGYDFVTLVEGITKEEHLELKKIMASLESVKNDEDVAVLKYKFAEYNKKRAELITKINELIATIKSKKGSQAPVTETAYYFDDNGVLVEYSLADLGSDVADTGRGVASGVTFGYADNIIAKAKSLLNGTSYADELKKELEKTAAAKERSPWLYGAGEVGGTFAIPGMAAVKGLKGAAALTGARLGSDLLVREPHNAATVAGATQSQQGQGAKPPAAASGAAPSNEEVKSIQTQLNQAGFSVGRHGVDGKFGPDTVKALQAYRQKNGIASDAEAIAKLLGVTATANEDISAIQRLAGLDEVAGAAASTFARMLPGLTGGASTALPSVVRIAGQTWKAVPGVAGKYSNGAGQVLDWAGLQALQKGGQAATTAATTAATQAGAKGTAALMQKLSAQSPKIAAGLAKAKAAGGKVLGFMKNNKFLTAVAALALFGYTFSPDGNLSGAGTGGGAGGGATGQSTKPTEIPEIAQLKELLKQLNDAYPADDETAQANAAAAEVGVKLDAETGQSTKPATNAAADAAAANRQVNPGGNF